MARVALAGNTSSKSTLQLQRHITQQSNRLRERVEKYTQQSNRLREHVATGIVMIGMGPETGGGQGTGGYISGAVEAGGQRVGVAEGGKGGAGQGAAAGGTQTALAPSTPVPPLCSHSPTPPEISPPVPAPGLGVGVTTGGTGSGAGGAGGAGAGGAEVRAPPAPPVPCPPHSSGAGLAEGGTYRRVPALWLCTAWNPLSVVPLSLVSTATALGPTRRPVTRAPEQQPTGAPLSTAAPTFLDSPLSALLPRNSKDHQLASLRQQGDRGNTTSNCPILNQLRICKFCRAGREILKYKPKTIQQSTIIFEFAEGLHSAEGTRLFGSLH